MQFFASSCLPLRRCLVSTRLGIGQRVAAPIGVRSFRRVTASATPPDPEQLKKLQETMDAAMNENPQVNQI